MTCGIIRLIIDRPETEAKVRVVDVLKDDRSLADTIRQKYEQDGFTVHEEEL